MDRARPAPGEPITIDTINRPKPHAIIEWPSPEPDDDDYGQDD